MFVRTRSERYQAISWHKLLAGTVAGLMHSPTYCDGEVKPATLNRSEIPNPSYDTDLTRDCREGVSVSRYAGGAECDLIEIACCAERPVAPVKN